MSAFIKQALFTTLILFGYYLYTHYAPKPTAPVVLSNTYEEVHKRYFIKYPADWIYTTLDDGSVIFSGPKGSDSFFTLVKIERLTASNLGTEKISIIDLAKDFIEQASQRGRILWFDFASLPSDPKRFRGVSVTVSYPYNGKQFKKIQYIIAQDSSQKEYYLWSYTAVEQYYNLSLPTINAMFNSWVIQSN